MRWEEGESPPRSPRPAPNSWGREGSAGSAREDRARADCARRHGRLAGRGDPPLAHPTSVESAKWVCQGGGRGRQQGTWNEGSDDHTTRTGVTTTCETAAMSKERPQTTDSVTTADAGLWHAGWKDDGDGATARGAKRQRWRRRRTSDSDWGGLCGRECNQVSHDNPQRTATSWVRRRQADGSTQEG